MRGICRRLYRHVYSAVGWKLCARIGKARVQQCCRTDAICSHCTDECGKHVWLDRGGRIAWRDAGAGAVDGVASGGAWFFLVLCSGSSVGAVRFVGRIHCVCFHWHLRGLLAASDAADWHSCIGNRDAARQVLCCVEAIRRTVAAVYAAVVCIHALETAACSGSARRVLTDKREKLCMFALLRNIHSFSIYRIVSTAGPLDYQ